jgi:DNA transformation protein and related proteins
MLAHYQELLAPLGLIRMRAMFGGHGIYCDEMFLAIVIDDQLYLKVDALTQPRFEQAGCTPFLYHIKGKTAAMSYWSAPADALESPQRMRPWAELALQAAHRKRAFNRHKPAGLPKPKPRS